MKKNALITGVTDQNGILYNHQSPRSGESFVTRKINRGFAKIAQGLEQCLYMGDMVALRDWGVYGGSYDSVDNGNRFQVKRIMVKPGAKLSLQMHHHRAGHWVVVSGTATVRIGEEMKLVTENE